MTPSKKPEEKKFYTPKELAARWEFDEQTLYRKRRDGSGPKFQKFGRDIRYSISEIEKYEAEHEMTSTAEN